MSELFKGTLIDQSVLYPEKILEKARITGTRETTLEGESFRGKVLFHKIQVTPDQLWPVLAITAETIKSPGWYFHLVNSNKLYVVMPNVILIASNNEGELESIIDYATSHGIHRDQLNLQQLFSDPYA